MAYPPSSDRISTFPFVFNATVLFEIQAHRTENSLTVNLDICALTKGLWQLKRQKVAFVLSKKYDFVFGAEQLHFFFECRASIELHAFPVVIAEKSRSNSELS